MIEVIIISIIILSLAVSGIAIKILIKKNGEFSGTCSSNNPFLNNNNKTCSYCGASPNEDCKSKKSGESEETKLSKPEVI